MILAAIWDVDICIAARVASDETYKAWPLCDAYVQAPNAIVRFMYQRKVQNVCTQDGSSTGYNVHIEPGNQDLTELQKSLALPTTGHMKFALAVWHEGLSTPRNA